MAGKYFEELELGARFEHEPGRTVTETDNLLFTALTLNPQPLHLDAEFAGQSIHGHGEDVLSERGAPALAPARAVA